MKGPKTRPCDPSVAQARLSESEDLLDAAESVRGLANDEADIGDAYVTLCVHAGIAAADAICCMRLGYHVASTDRHAAVAELSRVRPDGGQLGGALRLLLGMQNRSGIEAPATPEQRDRARRRAEQLFEAASRASGPADEPGETDDPDDPASA